VLKRLRRNSFPNPTLTAAAKAGIHNTAVSAAPKRCAAQIREQDGWEQDSVLPQAATCARGHVIIAAMEKAVSGGSTLTTLTVAEASQLVRSKKVSPVELTEACLGRIEGLNPELNAFITVTADSSLAEARAAEAEIQRGLWRGPVHGIPIALKDLIDTAGVRTTAASNLFRNRVPTEDAEAVTRLKSAGAVFLGKLNMHEFAFGASSVVSAFGPVRNPCDPEYSAGGSSSGSAAAVAAGLCYAAVGTDTGGSIRQPAAFCGIVGFKPTYGLVNARGVVPLSTSLDHVGPMARTVTDTALLLQVLAGREDPSYAAALKLETSSLRIGIPRAYFYDSLPPEIQAAMEAALAVLGRLSQSLQSIELGIDFEANNRLGNLLTKAEAYAYHREHVARNPELYQPETLRRIRAGAEVGAEAYSAALRELEEVRRLLVRIFETVDVLVTPTVPVPPFKIADLLSDPETLRSKEQITLRNTRPFSVLGLPTISVPCELTSPGLPSGLQITGAPGTEAIVLGLAAAYERATGFSLRA
jgi:aspartyl-tRNA(Asn)/glutamyl-tRNA(Gln) amidotransferase subunit A